MDKIAPTILGACSASPTTKSPIILTRSVTTRPRAATPATPDTANVARPVANRAMPAPAASAATPRSAIAPESPSNPTSNAGLENTIAATPRMVNAPAIAIRALRTCSRLSCPRSIIAGVRIAIAAAAITSAAEPRSVPSIR